MLKDETSFFFFFGGGGEGLILSYTSYVNLDVLSYVDFPAL